ncbi:L-seryl-tRNA(Sec) selenium transferase [Tomitella fengzijianii]|uniref:L-seryl-tRNA(Sec) selenium transferase n=2 Tax=Tomitella fengzijianii TaxID=2597660 RepID=A0A516X759_9ACTN|nr:L-seryl-tRNA(Sec) selenium transferase [Tomitella fengzijianii]
MAAQTGEGGAADPRRRVPSTDALLRDERMRPAVDVLGAPYVKAWLKGAQDAVRAGDLAPEDVVQTVLAQLPAAPITAVRVLNATGVLLHTNLGRAPLSEAAVRAVGIVAGATDVELDLATGRRGARGRGALEILRAAVPDAEDAYLVNNGAAALALAATALTPAHSRVPGSIVIARGEMVEIGDGFRLPDLLESTGATLREVGTTNRVTADDYAEAVDDTTAFILKVHPSNFVISGFTAGAGVHELRGLGVPVVADIGSGLLVPHPALPDEPSAGGMLRAGADLVTASGDKLLGGPQAGVVVGRADLIHAMRRHPLARALRVDKLTLAAFEATVGGPRTPTMAALEADPRALRARADQLAEALRGDGIDAEAVDSRATVGGGGAPGVELPSAAVSLPTGLAAPLRAVRPAVLGRVTEGRLLLDLRAVAEADDDLLAQLVRAAR